MPARGYSLLVNHTTQPHVLHGAKDIMNNFEINYGSFICEGCGRLIERARSLSDTWAEALALKEITMKDSEIW